MSNIQREARVPVPADTCPFCGGEMVSGSLYVPAEPTEYYYHCGSCRANDDYRFGSYVDDQDEDDEDGVWLSYWMVPEDEVDQLQEPYRAVALVDLALQEAGDEA